MLSSLEVDRAVWFDLETEKMKMLPGQLELLDRLSVSLSKWWDRCPRGRRLKTRRKMRKVLAALVP
jgi:predicted NUDIX family NTP pyrophosphohydrolase